VDPAARVATRLLVVLASMALHVCGALFVFLLTRDVEPQPPVVTIAKVSLAGPVPKPAPVAAVPPERPLQPLREKPKDRPPVRKARARERDNVNPSQDTVQVRGGLSDSTRVKSDNTAPSTVVPQGNSSELPVDPSAAIQGDLAPVPTGSQTGAVDYSALAVEEGFADVPADCAGALPDLDLTSDALNAGLRRGRLAFEAVIDESGRVREVRLIKGTGYDIDRVARDALQGIVCRPAQASGRAAIVRKELVFEVVDY
jgi:outer membrane biosynthesis protein TonB